MSAFTEPLQIEEVIPGKRWRLLGEIRYEARVEGSGQWIVVPAGFETDGATLPAALRLVLAVWGTYGRAACVHDFLYGLIRHKAWDDQAFAALAGKPADPLMVRAWADAEFHTAMIACGTSRPLAWLMWAAVRAFGGFYLAQSRQEKAHG
jgi:hypothetical protein